MERQAFELESYWHKCWDLDGWAGHRPYTLHARESGRSFENEVTARWGGQL